jgi:hypothetical protein
MLTSRSSQVVQVSHWGDILGSAARQGNWNGLRRALALLRKRPAFFGVLALLLVVGVTLMTAAHTNMIFNHESEVPRDLAGSLGEALIVAFFLALLVDPVAQHQFATEWGRDLYWAIFSPDAPAEFRESLQLLAAPTGYIRRCTYELTFSPSVSEPDQVLDLDLVVRAEGVVLDRRGWRPNDSVFTINRHDGSHSTYRLWAFRGDDVEPAEFNERELKALGALQAVPSGRTVLDQSLIPQPIGKVPFRKAYETERHVSTSRRRADFYPLFQNRTVLEQLFIVRGDVTEELEISVVQFGGDKLTRRLDSRPGGRVEIQYWTKSVAFPGQASVIEWRPKKSL